MNLIRLTVTIPNKYANKGSYSFNTLWIKRVKEHKDQNGNVLGSLFYYVDGNSKESGATKIFVSESVATINNSLTGPLDMQILVNVISKDNTINVNIEQEHIKTSDIIFGYADPSDSSKSYIVVAETPLDKVKYRVNNTLSSIETAANTYDISGGGGSWGTITGDIADQSDLQAEFAMTTTTFSNSILLDKVVGRNYGINDVTSNITISLDFTNIKDGGNAQVGLRGDGNHTPVLTAFNKQDSGGLDYDPTLNTINSFAFFRWLGKVYWSILDQYIASGPLTLSAPGSFTATSPSTTSISLSWTVVANASSYKLEWSANGTSGWTQIGGALSQATNSYSHTGLTSGVQYFYRISSIGDGTNYLTSGFASTNTTVAVPTTLTAPTVTGSALGQTSLRFSWSNITNNSGYRYKISTDNGSTFGTPVDLGTGVTSFDITGLTTGTRRDVQVLTLGDGVTYLNSSYSTTANSTTSSLTQLSTPTLNAPTVISSTQINLGWSTVSNVTSWKLETSANGTTGWSQIGGTIASGTLSYNHTSLTANTAYYYRLTTVGNGIVYSDSNPSSNVNATTKTVAPTLVSSATSTDGLTITHTFSRAMAASPTTTGYSTSPSKTISSATRNADTTKIDVVVSVAFASTDTITATIPQWSPADGGDNYAGVTGQSVTNNTVASVIYITWDILTNMAYNSGTHKLQKTVSNASGNAVGSDLITDGKSVQCTAVVPSTGMSNMFFGLKVLHQADIYTQFKYVWELDVYTSAFHVCVNGNNTPVATLTANNGDLLRIRRSGTNIIFEHSSNSGSTWTTDYTATGESNTNLYPFAVDAANSISNAVSNPIVV